MTSTALHCYTVRWGYLLNNASAHARALVIHQIDDNHVHVVTACLALFVTAPVVGRSFTQEDMESGNVTLSLQSTAKYGNNQFDISSAPSDTVNVVLDGRSASLDLTLSVSPLEFDKQGESGMQSCAACICVHVSCRILPPRRIQQGSTWRCPISYDKHAAN